MTAFNSKWKYEKLAVRLIVSVRGHFALLFCRGRLWNVQKFTKHTFTPFVLLIKAFVWWCSLTSWFAPESVHTTPEEFKNAYSFISLRLGLRSRVIRHENGAFRKSSSNLRNLKTPALSFRVDGKHFKTNTIGSGVPGRDFLKQKYKTTGDYWVFKFLRCSVDDRA